LYAKNTTCEVTVLGSDSDKTLGADIQKKLAGFYDIIKYQESSLKNF